MRVLLNCDRFPYPLHNGQNLRIYHYVRELRDRHEFDLVCYGDRPPPEPLRGLFRDIWWTPRPIASSESFWCRVFHPLDPERMAVPSNEMAREIHARLRSGVYDLLWMSGWDTVINLPREKNLPFLCDAVDDGVLENWNALRASADIHSALISFKRVLHNVTFERRFFAPADCALFVSERDASVFHRVCRKTPVEVIQNGVDSEYFRPLGGSEDARCIVFEGSMSFLPNIDAAMFLATEILPRVREVLPDVTLTIVGRDPVAEVRNLKSDRVRVTGFVDDVRPYLDAAALFVCPMRRGAGIKNKVLQAWSMGKAVVASPLATGGLEVGDGKNVVIRKGAGALAAAVVELIRNEPQRRRIGLAARQTILEHYTWRTKALQLENLMMRLCRYPTHKVRHAVT
ncbi:glycosyltransferase family 4 protein [Nitrococcus mobilis]|uniref:Glycosyl transferase, group 1 n=1 Tax=Nitrococcus mobilis Nb-231 TaxID=314278 RepID=A4BT74_9GAMM|nr:glycosyltransferase family 4 protein [Nitrococcus mobilis]EAR21142.1 Glycosyl transferase, group 1 [Nitrococcus mobilis Nb-231]